MPGGVRVVKRSSGLLTLHSSKTVVVLPSTAVPPQTSTCSRVWLTFETSLTEGSTLVVCWQVALNCRVNANHRNSNRIPGAACFTHAHVSHADSFVFVFVLPTRRSLADLEFVFASDINRVNELLCSPHHVLMLLFLLLSSRACLRNLRIVIGFRGQHL